MIAPDIVVPKTAPNEFDTIPIKLLPIILVEDDRKFIEKTLPKSFLGINSPNNPSLRVRIFIIEKLNKNKNVKLIICESLCANNIMHIPAERVFKAINFVLFFILSPKIVRSIVDETPPIPITVNKYPTP